MWRWVVEGVEVGCYEEGGEYVRGGSEYKKCKLLLCDIRVAEKHHVVGYSVKQVKDNGLEWCVIGMFVGGRFGGVLVGCCEGVNKCGL